MPTGESGPETAGAEGRNAGHRLPGSAGRGFRSHRRAPRSGGASISSRAGRGPAVPPPEEAGQSRGTAGGLSSADAHRGQRPPEARMRAPPAVGSQPPGRTLLSRQLKGSGPNAGEMSSRQKKHKQWKDGYHCDC